VVEVASSNAPSPLLECVVNVSEGRNDRTLDQIAAACQGMLLDLHRDPAHHRAVLTLAGEAWGVESAARSLTEAAVRLLDLGSHQGVHPRFGVVDVVPFVSLPPELGQPARHTVGPGWVDANAWDRVSLGSAVQARDRFADWAATALALPCFRYGPLTGGSEQTLPEIRRRAFSEISPDTGPPGPHPTAGAVAVGARRALIAYNLWLSGTDAMAARRLAASISTPAVRALGLDVGDGIQVSCNLVDPMRFGPADLYDDVAGRLSGTQRIERAELVGLIPGAILGNIAPERWRELGLSPDVTVEWRLRSGGAG
jgi:glutamate formiminotransferase